MSTLTEISSAVRERRTEIGLTQTRLAQLAGLSRATINELEKGSISNISVTLAERVLNTLGLSLGVARQGKVPAPARFSALKKAAMTASVSFRSELPETQLARILRGNDPPDEFLPHIRNLLDEAPISLLASVAGELEKTQGIPRQETWSVMRSLAKQLSCTREIWL
jgi:transcriptional regulator with XRE-family HTH domain